MHIAPCEFSSNLGSTSTKVRQVSFIQTFKYRARKLFLQMVDLDIQRQSMRKAARAVQKQHQSIANRDRIWVMHPGNVALHETPQDALQWMDAGVRHVT